MKSSFKAVIEDVVVQTDKIQPIIGKINNSLLLFYTYNEIKCNIIFYYIYIEYILKHILIFILCTYNNCI